MFHVVDVILLLIVLVFTYSGFYYGFIHAFGQLLGVFIGLFLAGYVLLWLELNYQISQQPTEALIIFIVTVLAVSFLLGLFIEFLDGTVSLFSRVPFLEMVNRFFGALVGFAEALLFLAAIAFFARDFLSDGPLRETLLSSALIQKTAWLESLIQPILSNIL